MKKEHNYLTTIKWTGNIGKGTKDYRSYERCYEISVINKPEILGSSDPAFSGDKSKHNPEELLVASISSCHMLWYLHLCAVNGVNVLEYSDKAKGLMIELKSGSGQFSKVELNPEVVVSDEAMVEKANELHKQANKLCFIANSLNFKVDHNPKCTVK